MTLRIEVPVPKQLKVQDASGSCRLYQKPSAAWPKTCRIYTPKRCASGACPQYHGQALEQRAAAEASLRNELRDLKVEKIRLEGDLDTLKLREEAMQLGRSCSHPLACSPAIHKGRKRLYGHKDPRN